MRHFQCERGVVSTVSHVTSRTSICGSEAGFFASVPRNGATVNALNYAVSLSQYVFSCRRTEGMIHEKLAGFAEHTRVLQNEPLTVVNFKHGIVAKQ